MGDDTLHPCPTPHLPPQVAPDTRIPAMSIADRLQALGITLPAVATPAAAYLPYMRTGNLVFLSGHIAKKDGQVWVGQLGKKIGRAHV